MNVMLVCSDISGELSSAPDCSISFPLMRSGILLAMSKYRFKVYLSLVASIKSVDKIYGCNHDLIFNLASDPTFHKTYSFPFDINLRMNRSGMCYSTT